MAEQQGELLGKSDPGNYRKLCEPFASMADVNTALEAFWEEFYELRNKHRFADVLVVLRIPVMADGSEGVVHTKLYAGDEGYAENMSAFALGATSVERQEATARLMKKAIKQIKAKK